MCDVLRAIFHLWYKGLIIARNAFMTNEWKLYHLKNKKPSCC